MLSVQSALSAVSQALEPGKRPVFLSQVLLLSLTCPGHRKASPCLPESLIQFDLVYIKHLRVECSGLGAGVRTEFVWSWPLRSVQSGGPRMEVMLVCGKG